MKCLFCLKFLTEEDSYAEELQIFACRDCQLPKYSTVYRQLYKLGERDLLHELIMVDDYCITKRYKSQTSLEEYSLVYKGIIGVMKGITSMHYLDPEPVTIHPPACKFDHIITVDASNLENLKHKLSTWITFS